MRSILSGGWPWLAGVFSAFFLLAGTQDVYPLPATARSAAVDAIAAYVPISRSLDAALESAGYGPPVAPSKDILSHMPDIKKIEYAYYAAERANPNKGGADLLAILQRKLANDAPAILLDPALSILANRSPTPPISFRRRGVTWIKPDSPTREAIARIADYGASGLGSQQRLLVTHFQMSEDAAYDLLHSNDNIADVLQQAYHESAGNGDKNLRSLARAVARVSPSIKYDSQVTAIFPDKAFPSDTVVHDDIFGNRTPRPKPPFDDSPYPTPPFGDVPHAKPPFDDFPYPTPPFGDVPHPKLPFRDITYPTPPFGDVPHRRPPFRDIPYPKPPFEVPHPLGIPHEPVLPHMPPIRPIRPIRR